MIRLRWILGSVLLRFVKLFFRHSFSLYLLGSIQFPLLITENQRNDLADFYCTSIRHTLSCLHWYIELFSFALDEKMLVDRSASYWNRYLVFLSDSTDGNLLFEKANLNEFRTSWLAKEYTISCLRKSKRYVAHKSILERITSWVSSVSSQSSVRFFERDDLLLLEDFAITFWMSLQYKKKSLCRLHVIFFGLFFFLFYTLSHHWNFIYFHIKCCSYLLSLSFSMIFLHLFLF